MRKKSNLMKITTSLAVISLALAPLLPAKAFFLVYDNQTCNINGVEMPGPCPASTGSQMGSQMSPGPQMGPNQGPMMGGQGQFNQGSQMGPGGQGQYGPGDQGMMGPGGEGQMMDDRGEQQRKQQEERSLKDMKRNVRQMESGIKQFEKMVQKAEKSGTAIPQEVKDNLAKAKTIIDTIKNATTFEEMQSAGMEDFGDLMQSLDQARQDLFEKAQRLQDIKRGLKGMEQGMRMFEKQLAMFAKQKVAVPQDVTDTLAKIKELIAKIKTAQTWEEIEAAGLDDMQDLFQKLDESRQQLEILARWPQTLKQMDKELKRLTTELKRSKTLVDRLLKKGTDLTSLYAEFEAAVNKLKSVKEEAVSKMNAGDADGAFDLVENEFFGQMEDTWELHKVLMTMANLGRFASDFKQGIAEAQRTIKMLKRRGLDVSELEELLNQAKVKGNEVLAMMKEKPIDEEAIMAGLQELEDMRQEFEEKVAELTGEERGGPMPWEQGQVRKAARWVRRAVRAAWGRVDLR